MTTVVWSRSQFTSPQSPTPRLMLAPLGPTTRALLPGIGDPDTVVRVAVEVSEVSVGGTRKTAMTIVGG